MTDEKKYHPYPDQTIMVSFFLRYRYIGDSVITIPRYNDVIKMAIPGFHSMDYQISQ